MDLRGYSAQSIFAGTIIGGTVAAAITYVYMTTKNSAGKPSENQVSGLANQGNTCYMNALLQGLASCPSFVGWLRSLKIEEMGIQGGFLESLADLMSALNESQGVTLTALPIVGTLASHGWNITIGVEHDLYELFNVFVTTWEDELKTSKKVLKNNSIENCFDEGSDSSASSSGSCSSSPIVNRKLLSFKVIANEAKLDNCLRSPCVGLTATLFRCCNNECKYQTAKYESFTALTLTIPNSQMGTSTNTESLLRRYFCSEIIRDAICDKCKAENRKQQGFLKKHGIVKCPQTLMIRIERVGMLPNGSMKLSEHVNFGECLNMQDVCFRKNPKINELAYENAKKWQLPDGTSRVVGGAEELRNRGSPIIGTPGTSQNAGYGDLGSFKHALIDGGSFVAEQKAAQKYSYQLRAVSEHRGGPYSGHFVTYRRAPAPNHSNWYYTSDAQVNRVPYSMVAHCQSYMLFYERVKKHRLYDREPIF